MATTADSHLRGLRGSVWLDQGRYEQAESKYLECLAHGTTAKSTDGYSAVGVDSGVSRSIEVTMSMIQESLSANPQTGRRLDLEKRVTLLEEENVQLKTDLAELRERIVKLESRLGTGSEDQKAEEEEDDFDLFGDDVAEEEEKTPAVPKPAKTKKPPVVAKSTIILDVKPWDSETDMKEVERLVREIACDGLVWGASKLVDVAFGIKKLQISCVVEDEKVGTDFLEEAITDFEDHVQSVDVAAFNKV